MQSRTIAAGTSSGPGFRRPLSTLESWFALSSMTIWYTVEVEGPIDLDMLREALGCLRREHPVLAGRLVPGSARRADGLPELDLLVPGGSEAAVRQDRAGSVLADQAKELAFLDVVRNGDRSSVSFAVHHAIADGRLGSFWHARLWSHYTDLAEGRVPAAAPRPVPQAPEALLAERGFDAAPRPDRSRRAVPSDLPEQTAFVFARERVRLSTRTTELLKARARALGTTVHALVAGACVVAERRSMPLPDDVAADLFVDTPVDVRPRLRPPAQPWDVTNALGNSPGLVAARPDDDPAAVGAQLLGQLRDDVASGAVYRGILRFTELLCGDQPEIPRITTTNIGEVEPIRAPSGVRVHDFRGWTEFDGSAIAAYLAANQKDGPRGRFSSLYLVYTYGGRLSVEIGLPSGAEAARAHAAVLEALLAEVASDEG
ncbi:phthiocerol/phthiodiolone dimycocerosyl transferase family protein [Segniliparus rugosus]|uniref:Phthiocerol/phthiodiolone dimycocerosyl transferase n=1 Tax=Segniliparus rugosus (strain ATCC BAA-974 / DSM 45345 / CCUG 50838 / CIP 108380 / JCM 13579 / CDC 945) TaxID=679197 RepID=E5XSX7_SEGRC|nr:hypothetical protein [Segniliparus rugosus]EFV12519.2 hypothetical protein HMPREF9336_02599 [Segniliparus rugosus ATCC BAA-974]